MSDLPQSGVVKKLTELFSGPEYAISNQTASPIIVRRAAGDLGPTVPPVDRYTEDIQKQQGPSASSLGRSLEISAHDSNPSIKRLEQARPSRTRSPGPSCSYDWRHDIKTEGLGALGTNHDAAEWSNSGNYGGRCYNWAWEDREPNAHIPREDPSYLAFLQKERRRSMERQDQEIYDWKSNKRESKSSKMKAELEMALASRREAVLTPVKPYIKLHKPCPYPDIEIALAKSRKEAEQDSPQPMEGSATPESATSTTEWQRYSSPMPAPEPSQRTLPLPVDRPGEFRLEDGTLIIRKQFEFPPEKARPKNLRTPAPKGMLFSFQAKVAPACRKTAQRVADLIDRIRPQKSPRKLTEAEKKKMRIYDPTTMGDDDISFGYEACGEAEEMGSGDELDADDFDLEMADDNEKSPESPSQTLMFEEPMETDDLEAGADQNKTSDKPKEAAAAPIAGLKRRSESLEADDSDDDLIIHRKRTRSGSESRGQERPMGRNRYVPLTAWPEELKTTATHLVQDLKMDTDALLRWSSSLGYLVKRRQLRKFIGRVKKGQTAQRKEGSGRPGKLVEENLAVVEAEIRRDPRVSMRQLATRIGLGLRTTQRICHEAGFKSYKMVPVHALTEANKETRLKCAKNLLNAIQSGEVRVSKLVFSDEKIINIDPPRGHEWVMTKAGSKREVDEEILDLPHGKPKGPGYMIHGAVSGNGEKLPLIILEQGINLGGPEYRYMLQRHITPAAQRLVGEDFIFQHDWAPGHNANETHTWLVENNIRYLDREYYPPNSPDLNVLDYSVWSMLERRVREIAAADTHLPLKERKERFEKALQRAWDELPQEAVRRAAAQLPERLALIIANDGGNIEAQHGCRVRYRKQ